MMAVDFITDPSWFVEVEDGQLEFPIEFPLSWDTQVIVVVASFIPGGLATYLDAEDVSFIE